MIVRLSGTLDALDTSDPRLTVALVDRDGLVYAVDVPAYVARELAPRVGQPITLHTLHYLEGSPAGGNLTPRLIGFLHAAHRRFLEAFTTVKGIGLRKALRALDQPPDVLAGWIESGQAKALSSLPEIGKRLAESIVVELRGKVGTWLVGPGRGPSGAGEPAAASPLSPAEHEAVQILVAWGDRAADAERAVNAVRESDPALANADAATLVRAVYRHRGR